MVPSAERKPQEPLVSSQQAARGCERAQPLAFGTGSLLLENLVRVPVMGRGVRMSPSQAPGSVTSESQTRRKSPRPLWRGCWIPSRRMKPRHILSPSIPTPSQAESQDSLAAANLACGNSEAHFREPGVGDPLGRDAQSPSTREQETV